MHIIIYTGTAILRAICYASVYGWQRNIQLSLNNIKKTIDGLEMINKIINKTQWNYI